MVRLRAPFPGASPNPLSAGELPLEPLLTRAALARRLSVSERYTYVLEAHGLARIDFGGCVRFDPRIVAAFVAERTRRRGYPSQAQGIHHSAPDLPAIENGSGGRGRPARVGLARELSSRSVDTLAPLLKAQAVARVGRGVRP